MKQTLLYIFSCLPCQSFQAFLHCFVITALKLLHTSHDADAATSLVCYNTAHQPEFAYYWKPAVLLHSDTSESGNILNSRSRKPPTSRCPCPSASRVMMLSDNPSSASLCNGSWPRNGSTETLLRFGKESYVMLRIPSHPEGRKDSKLSYVVYIQMFSVNSTFRWPCIVIYSYSKTNWMH